MNAICRHTGSKVFIYINNLTVKCFIVLQLGFNFAFYGINTLWIC